MRQRTVRPSSSRKRLPFHVVNGKRPSTHWRRGMFHAGFGKDSGAGPRQTVTSLPWSRNQGDPARSKSGSASTVNGASLAGNASGRLGVGLVFGAPGFEAVATGVEGADAVEGGTVELRGRPRPSGPLGRSSVCALNRGGGGGGGERDMMEFFPLPKRSEMPEEASGVKVARAVKGGKEAAPEIVAGSSLNLMVRGLPPKRGRSGPRSCATPRTASRHESSCRVRSATGPSTRSPTRPASPRTCSAFRRSSSRRAADSMMPLTAFPSSSHALRPPEDAGLPD